MTQICLRFVFSLSTQRTINCVLLAPSVQLNNQGEWKTLRQCHTCLLKSIRLQIDNLAFSNIWTYVHFLFQYMHNNYVYYWGNAIHGNIIINNKLFYWWPSINTRNSQRKKQWLCATTWFNQCVRNHPVFYPVRSHNPSVNRRRITVFVFWWAMLSFWPHFLRGQEEVCVSVCEWVTDGRAATDGVFGIPQHLFGSRLQTQASEQT